MIATLKRRLAADQSGFTLIELLVVIIILGVLLAIAVPSYLGFKGRSEKAAAKSNVRAAVPAVEAFYSDNNTYVGMTLAKLQASYDAGVKLNQNPSGLSTTSYCIESAVGGSGDWSKTGPAGNITAASCP